MQLIEVKEGTRYFLNSTRRKIQGTHRFDGTAKQICEQIVNKCWNGTYFQNSLGNYKEFWTRDFGLSTQSLLKLGHKQKVHSTLKYALEKFSRQGEIKTTITPNGKAFSFPKLYSPDSTALFFRSLRLSNAKDLINEHYDFLQNEVDKFFKLTLDPTTNLVFANKRFSSMRDYSIRSSSCYDNCTAELLAKEAKQLGFKHENFEEDFAKTIKEKFWTGTHFADDLNSTEITGDANIFPFWTGIFDNKKMLKTTIKTIRKNNLDKPLSLKYTSSKTKEKTHWANIFVPNWEQNYSWTNMAPIYMQLAGTIDKKYAKEQLNAYKQLIERDGTLFELYNDNKKPFKNAFYFADEGMLWAANFETLL